jgi:hypothetical protein
VFLIVENFWPPDHGLLRANPETLKRFADEADHLADRLERISSDASEAARFASPSTDPATLRTAHRLAADGNSLLGTPVRRIAEVVEVLRRQAATARETARRWRDIEQGIVERLRIAGGEDQT